MQHRFPIYRETVVFFMNEKRAYLNIDPNWFLLV